MTQLYFDNDEIERIRIEVTAELNKICAPFMGLPINGSLLYLAQVEAVPKIVEVLSRFARLLNAEVKEEDIEIRIDRNSLMFNLLGDAAKLFQQSPE